MVGFEVLLLPRSQSKVEEMRGLAQSLFDGRPGYGDIKMVSQITHTWSSHDSEYLWIF